MSEILNSNTGFFVIDKMLFKNDSYRELSDSAKLTHGILHDLTKLSTTNNWIDEDGIYINITNKQLGEILNKSENSIIKIKKELEKVGLLKQKRVGFSKPNKLYLFEPES